MNWLELRLISPAETHETVLRTPSSTTRTSRGVPRTPARTAPERRWDQRPDPMEVFPLARSCRLAAARRRERNPVAIVYLPTVHRARRQRRPGRLVSWRPGFAFRNPAAARPRAGGWAGGGEPRR